MLSQSLFQNNLQKSNLDINSLDKIDNAILQVLRFFNPGQDIPYSLLTSWLLRSGFVKDEKHIESTLNQVLERLGPIIQVNPIKKTLQVKAKVQEFKTENLATDTTLEFLGKAISDDFYRETEPLQDEERRSVLFKHMDTLLSAYKELNFATSPCLAYLLDAMGHYYCYQLNDSRKAEVFYTQAAALLEKSPSKEDQQRHSIVLNCLGAINRDLGNYADAIKFLNTALAMKEKLFGKEHMETARTVENLGNCYVKPEESKQQKELLDRSLAIHTKIDPTMTHWKTAMCLTAFAQTVTDSKEKIATLRKALHIKEKAFYPEHFHVTTTLHELAKAIIESNPEQQELEKAKEMLEKVFKIERLSLGSPHPNISSTLFELSKVYGYIGDVDKKIGRLNDALELRKECLIKNDIKLAEISVELANTYGAIRINKSKEEQVVIDKQMLALREQALAIHKGFYGENHFEVTNTLSHLIPLYGLTLDLGKMLKTLDEVVKVVLDKYKDSNEYKIGNMALRLARACGAFKSKWNDAFVLANKAKDIFTNLNHNDLAEVIKFINDLNSKVESQNKKEQKENTSSNAPGLGR